MSSDPSAPVVVTLADEAATIRLGAALARTLSPGMLVLLDGDLGTGKTALARATIRALVGDDTLDVPSPSFALVQPYEADTVCVLHADLYRLAAAGETRELGLFDEESAIVLVEWPDRDPALAVHADLVIALTHGAGETERRLTLTSPSSRVDCAALAGSL